MLGRAMFMYDTRTAFGRAHVASTIAERRVGSSGRGFTPAGPAETHEARGVCAEWTRTNYSRTPPSRCGTCSIAREAWLLRPGVGNLGERFVHRCRSNRTAW